GTTDVQSTPDSPNAGQIDETAATPPPRLAPSPASNDAPPVATPVPPTPLPAAKPSAPQPIATASDATGTVVLPSPVASGYHKTDVPTDLAVSGPAYFVLATKPDPQGLEDLVFTRNGHFKLVSETDGGLNILRLRHDPDDFHVVAYARENAGESAPDERSGTGDSVIATTWQGTAVAADGLALDADRNPDALNKIGFDYTGRLQIGGADPRASDGQSEALLLALAEFANSSALAPVNGFPGMYRYQAAAGTITMGVGVSGPNRTLGDGNLLLDGNLEGS
ncbi:MAG TPA: hypothetical protein V6D47_16135, partial [Oscillatoriaceae cyanobacterium]